MNLNGISTMLGNSIVMMGRSASGSVSLFLSFSKGPSQSNSLVKDVMDLSSNRILLDRKRHVGIIGNITQKSHKNEFNWTHHITYICEIDIWKPPSLCVVFYVCTTHCCRVYVKMDPTYPCFNGLLLHITPHRNSQLPTSNKPQSTMDSSCSTL